MSKEAAAVPAARQTSPDNIGGLLALLRQKDTEQLLGSILAQTQLFEEAKVPSLAVQFRDQAIRTVEQAVLDTRKMLEKFHPSVTFDAILRLARMGCPYNPQHGLGFIVEKKNNLVPMPGIRSMERIVQSDPRVKFVQAAAIRAKDKYSINRFDPRVPPVHDVALDVSPNEANPIIGSLATILIGDVFHSVVLRLSHTELAAEKGFMDVEDRAKYRALRAACREVINRYMRNDSTEAAIADLMSADQEAAMMFAAQAGAQAQATPPQQPAATTEQGSTVSAPQSNATPLAGATGQAGSAPELVPPPPRPAPAGPSPVDQILERRGEAVDPLPPPAPGRSSRRA